MFICFIIAVCVSITSPFTFYTLVCVLTSKFSSLTFSDFLGTVSFINSICTVVHTIAHLRRWDTIAIRTSRRGRENIKIYVHEDHTVSFPLMMIIDTISKSLTHRITLLYWKNKLLKTLNFTHLNSLLEHFPVMVGQPFSSLLSPQSSCLSHFHLFGTHFLFSHRYISLPQSFAGQSASSLASLHSFSPSHLHLVKINSYPYQCPVPFLLGLF